MTRLIVCAILCFASLARCDSGDPPPPDQFAPTDDLITPAAQRLIESGLAYLSDHQRPDGSYGSEQYAGNVAVTALVGMAFLSSGSTPQEGPYRENLARITDYLVEHTSASGFVIYQNATTHGPMYDHGFGTLYLAEVYGMTDRPDVREKLKKAINLIIYTQNDEGGWRYVPQRVPDADISVTICQMMALRAARNAGIAVPRSTVDRCTKYVKDLQNADGGFRYQMRGVGESGFPRSAAGVVALFNAGISDSPEIERGIEYVLKYQPNRQRGQESHYFYGHYYAALAMYQAGGDRWTEWYAAIRDDLINRSRGADGRWTSSGVCDEYGTAMALIILQMPNNYLPIFQR